MKQQKRHRTNFISGVIALVTLGLLVLLAVALYKHTELEVRFDALISWLRRLDESIVGLDSDFEIILCIFALYVAKCQLPIPMGVLCVISGVVFPLGQAMLINMVFWRSSLRLIRGRQLDRRRLGRYDLEYSSNALYSGLDSI